MVIKRGDIWWANLPEPTGSGPGYARPVLIVQSDKFTETALNTVVIAIITRNLHLSKAAGNVLIAAEQSYLRYDSVINVSQLFTMDKGFLRDYISTLSNKKMAQVDKGLKMVLSL